MANIYTEPNWTELSAETYPGRSAFDINSTSPMQITGFIVNLLQYHFSSTKNIENSTLETLLWNSDNEQSEIFIGRSDKRDTKVSSQLPGIFVERLNCENPAKGLSRSLININKDGSLQQDCADYCKTLKGSHAVLCECEKGASSEALAEEVWRRMMYFSPAIQQDFVMSYFDTSAIGKTEQKRDRNTDSFITTVQLVWVKDYKWTLETEQLL
jgi:hypothetical protein